MEIIVVIDVTLECARVKANEERLLYLHSGFIKSFMKLSLYFFCKDYLTHPPQVLSTIFFCYFLHALLFNTDQKKLSP